MCSDIIPCQTIKPFLLFYTFDDLSGCLTFCVPLPEGLHPLDQHPFPTFLDHILNSRLRQFTWHVQLVVFPVKPHHICLTKQGASTLFEFSCFQIFPNFYLEFPFRSHSTQSHSTLEPSLRSPEFLPPLCVLMVQVRDQTFGPREVLYGVGPKVPKRG